ncbi:SLAP domain-containing protein [Tumebacillus sp. BK434]|uniref:SLAP domain-containing protein n=1 Tax=Tumebacillus sp. BK434 TaxID=2512169 RepID=UPI0010E8EE74|nr:SLAP domain-containing protein [Tumebacillus sp. BK434]TCP57772.1 SLAP domain-containing protein [Tumebacillus sp. BK434]
MEMKKESFFTRLFARKVEEQSEPAIDEAAIPMNAQTLPHTLIAFTEEQEAKFTEEQKEDLQKKLLELPPLRLGEINFVPFDAGSLFGGYFVRVFIRQGRDLLEEFTLNELPLFLIDASGEKVAGGVFRPQNFGTLRFGESRVWTFAWRPEQVLKKEVDLTQFTVAFE